MKGCDAMVRRLLSALGVLTLGWAAGLAQAADPNPSDALPAVPLMPAAADCAGNGGSRLDAGAGFYFLKVSPGHDTAGTLTFQSLGRNFDSIRNDAALEFRHDFEFAPLIWLGYTTNCGLGARVRWWHFDAQDNLGAVLPTTTTVDGTVSGTFFTPAAAFGTDVRSRTV